MRQVRTRGGVFGSGGYGGGLFDGSNSGFGGLGATYEQAAAGVGLGAIAWKDKANPDASVKALQAWLNKPLIACGYYGIGVDGVVGPGTCGAIAMLGDLKNQSCADPYWGSAPLGTMTSVIGVCQSYTMPTKKGSSTPDKPTTTLKPEDLALPWGVADPRTGPVQGQVNVELVGHDYLPVGVTGSLDAATCGAMKLARDQWGVDYMNAYGLNCKAFTTPTKKPGTGPITPPVAPPKEQPITPPVVKKKGGVSTAWIVGGLLAAGLVAGVAVAASKKKK